MSASVRLNSAEASNLPQAIRWLADQGVRVINMSFGTSANLTELRAVAYAECKDIVLVAATGDVVYGFIQPGPPATFPGVLAVTGVGKNFKRDPGATIGKGTALAAPFSTTATDPFDLRKPYTGLPVAEPASAPSAYSDEVGTSLSAPIVAGVVALIRAKHPDENAATVISRLIRSATPAGGSVPNVATATASSMPTRH